MLEPFKVSIMDRYILVQFFKNLLLALCLFVSIYLFSILINDMAYFINRMEAGDTNITMPKILMMYAHQIPYIVLWVSPLSFLFSTIYTIGTLYKNNEAVGYVSAGVHIFRMNLGIVVLSLVYSFLLIPFTDLVVVPHSRLSESLETSMLRKQAEEPSRNFETFGENDMYFFMKQYDVTQRVMEYPIIAQERITDNTEYNNPLFPKKTRTQKAPPSHTNTQHTNTTSPQPQSNTEAPPSLHYPPLAPTLTQSNIPQSPTLAPPLKTQKQNTHEDFFKRIEEPVTNTTTPPPATTPSPTNPAPIPTTKTTSPTSPPKQQAPAPQTQASPPTQPINPPPAQKEKPPTSPQKTPKKENDKSKALNLDFEDIKHLMRRPTTINTPIKNFVVRETHKSTDTLEQDPPPPIPLQTQNPTHTSEEYFPHSFQLIQEPSIYDLNKTYFTKQLNALQKIRTIQHEHITLDDMNISGTAYKTRPFPAPFRFRLDAQEGRWDTTLQKWVLYNVEKRIWDEYELIKVEHFDTYVLNEVLETPDHFTIKHEDIQNLTFSEGKTLITSLRTTRRQWKTHYIDLYAHKIAFQLSTFLIVFVGVNITRFHSRKLSFTNSLFLSIVLFIIYFTVFQVGISLSKAWTSFPIALAPWIGNIVFFMFGVYRIQRVAT